MMTVSQLAEEQLRDTIPDNCFVEARVETFEDGESLICHLTSYGHNPDLMRNHARLLNLKAGKIERDVFHYSDGMLWSVNGEKM